MTALINQIVALSGPVPDEAAFRRYLANLSPAQLRERLENLNASTTRSGTRSPLRSPRFAQSCAPFST